MILLLGNQTAENMLCHLTAKYLQLDKFFNLQMIRTTDSTLKAFNALSYPTLIKEDGSKLNSIQSILYEFSLMVNLDQLLFGENDKQRNSIAKHFDIAKTNQENMLKYYTAQLENSVFLEDNHITMADLVAFTYTYNFMKDFTNEQKFENNHVFRWYNHMQNLTGIKENWEGECVRFPVVVKSEDNGKVDKKNLKAQKKADAQANRPEHTKCQGEQAKGGEQHQPPAEKPQQPPAEKQQQPPAEKPQQPPAEKPQPDQSQKQQQPKKEKQQKGQTEKGKKPAPVKGSDEELLLQFSNLELRIGSLDEAWKHPESEKLWCEKINIGREVRQIASGLQKNVPLDQMNGLVVVASNLKPKKLAGKYLYCKKN